MRRESEEELIQFCANQYHCFDSQAWLSFKGQKPRILAMVAYFLATTPWFGNVDELVRIAQTLDPHVEENLVRNIKESNFDCGRFSSMLQQRLSEA